MSSGRIAIVLGCITPLVFFGGACCLLEYGSDLGLFSSEMRPGIGSVERAKSKIKTGMTKDEVRALLGRPHVELMAIPDRDLMEEWLYYDSRWLVGSKLSVGFGCDDRVIWTSTWLV